jgi:adenylyl cyclase-associated protein
MDCRDPKHVEWVRSFYAIHKALISYIQDNYATGVTWNNKDGIDAAEAVRQVQAEESSGGSSGAAAAAPPPAPGPPPPPPLPTFDTPPPPPPMPAGGAAQAPSGGLGAVFSQISQGEAVTKGLRKVDTSEMTHKNPSLRADSRVPPTRSDSSSPRGKSPVPGKKPQTLRTKKPPKKELDGKKWVLENFDAPADGMIEIEAEISQSILISRCNKTTIRVIGKANAVSIDSSSAVSLIIDSLVSSVEVIKVPKFEMQVLGNLPTIMLDQVDGAQIYLGRESLGTEVFTSKCTAVNINVPGKTDEDDYREEAVPEQLKTVIRDGRAVSEIVEHAG